MNKSFLDTSIRNGVRVAPLACSRPLWGKSYGLSRFLAPRRSRSNGSSFIWGDDDCCTAHVGMATHPRTPSPIHEVTL